MARRDIERLRREAAEIKAEIGARMLEPIAVYVSGPHETPEDLNRRIREDEEALLARAGLTEFPPEVHRTTVIIQKLACRPDCRTCGAQAGHPYQGDA